MTKNKFLATQVMGWRVVSREVLNVMYTVNYISTDCYVDVGDKVQAIAESWNPSEDLKQAFQLLDNFMVWNLKTRSNGIYSCRIGSHAAVHDGSKCIAITEAVLRARGFYDEELK